MKRIYFLFLAIFSLNLVMKASDRADIKISIENYPDTTLLLTTYYGDKIVLVDTANSLIPGQFIFGSDSLYPEGIYMAVSSDKKKLFEFIIGRQQDFRLTTDTSNYSLHMKVRGSEENTLFFDYMRFNETLFKSSEPLREATEGMDKQLPEYKQLKHQIDSVNELAVDYKLKIIRKYPDLFISTLLNSMHEVEIPDSIKSAPDSSLVYRYYKKHYWDYFDLSDSRLLHTPLYSKKVDEYFDQLVVVHPDSVIASVDQLIELARPNNETVSWLVWHFVSEYQNPQYMGFDVVFIHLADNYFAKEEILNATPSVKQTIQERADAMRPLVLGSPAPDLMLIDTSGAYRSFMSMRNKYVMLFFWDYDCSICRRELEKTQELIKTTTHDIGVFAISVNGDLEKWKEAIKERKYNWVNVNGTRSVTQDFHMLYDTHGTPAIFLLDKDKKIIAKQLSAEQVESFIENFEKRNTP